MARNGLRGCGERFVRVGMPGFAASGRLERIEMNFLGSRPVAIKRPRTASMDEMITIASRLAIIGMGVVVMTVALDAGQILLAPFALAIVIGLIFGPLAARVEAIGVPPSLSALIVVIAFTGLIAVAITSIVVPLSEWSRYLPQIWERVKDILSDWKDVLSSMQSLRDGLQSAVGTSGRMQVEVADDSAITSAAWLAPAILTQVLIFLSSLYFFVATRNQIRLAILSLCFERRLRWRVAHIFRDVELLVSRYLLSITAINIGLGVAVSIAMWLLGVPSPLLWGALAGLLNYVIYIGPAIMAAILACVGLATGDGLAGALLPPIVYLAINLVEAQFVTPHVVGRTLTLNPFLVFVALAFWIWIWGAVGGFIAVPLLLIMTVMLRHMIPGNHRRYAALQNNV
jgi:predicted PurR-regulated permease PerM